MATSNDENTNRVNKKYQILIDTASKKEIELSKIQAPNAYLYDATLSTDEGKSWHHVFIDPFRARQSVIVKASPDHRKNAPQSIDDLSYAGEVRLIERETESRKNLGPEVKAPGPRVAALKRETKSKDLER